MDARTSHHHLSYRGPIATAVTEKAIRGVTRLATSRVGMRTALALATGGASEVLIATQSMVSDLGRGQSDPPSKGYSPLGV